MATIIKQKVRLPKHIKNQDLAFREYQFKGGVLELQGTPEEVALHVNYLKVNLSVTVDGEVETQAPADPAEGNADADADANTRLAAALKQLDPKNDDHWTQAGKPAIAAVEKLYGDAGITRADVDAAIPGFDRESAKQGD